MNQRQQAGHIVGHFIRMGLAPALQQAARGAEYEALRERYRHEWALIPSGVRLLGAEDAALTPGLTPAQVNETVAVLEGRA